ncbi:MAG: META domain-containing protein [Citrobacter freundii]|nr:MAG: META domain-containing protein [Citrobacter freundii]
MKKLLLALILLSFIACNSSKKAASNDPASLDGTWTLNYISGPRIAFEGLYPNKKPQIIFNSQDRRVSGNTGCNSFSGPLVVDGNKINFDQPMAMTKMACPGEGEMVFLETLKKVNTWSVSDGNTLNLIMGDIAVMRFSRK